MPQSLELDFPSKKPAKPGKTAPAAKAAGAPAWPATLPAQVKAVADVLAASPGGVTVVELEARFKGKGPWKKALPRILETLEALGRARREGALWRA